MVKLFSALIILVVFGLLNCELIICKGNQTQKKGRTNHSQVPKKLPNPLELGEYVKLFMISPEQQHVPWDIGVDNKQFPIEWITEGIEDTPRGLLRKAKAHVKVNGSIMTVLKKAKEEVLWNITIQGNKFGPNNVTIEPMSDCFGYTGSGCDFDISKALHLTNISSKELCEKIIHGDSATLFSITTSGKQPAYLVYYYSGGSGGGTNWIQIFWEGPKYDTKEEACFWLKTNENLDLQ